jgi:hypothetical protein
LVVEGSLNAMMGAGRAGILIQQFGPPGRRDDALRRRRPALD